MTASQKQKSRENFGLDSRCYTCFYACKKDLICNVINFAGTLHSHLESNGIEYLQFSFRWMNNLLTRELPLRCLIRLWDTYLSELDTFSTFQLFVCASFLLHWRDDLLLEKDFQVSTLFCYFGV